MIVLDTDIVTLISYGKNEKLRKRLEDVPDDEELAITVITSMEILQGRFASILKAATAAELSAAMERFTDSKAFLESYQLLDVTEDAAKHFTAMTMGKKKPKMKRGDMLNACIALAHKALLITRNTKDYQTVAGLKIENWAD
jgi:tRNA(fMet)-specific endonuclease VapC